jgi:hypothetical protein
MRGDTRFRASCDTNSQSSGGLSVLPSLGKRGWAGLDPVVRSGVASLSLLGTGKADYNVLKAMLG